jgi:hypothetical protein
MFSLPVNSLINSHFPDSLGEAVSNRDGEPLPTISSFDLVAVLKFVFLVLHCVEQTEDIGPIQFIDIA